mmetsp:Transcript_4152/g.8169  ORF Transcript_4152/g.8169 Transcript_4152/m.8169 type:complete len:282 (-) Transcript_4152:770-1615(-)
MPRPFDESDANNCAHFPPCSAAPSPLTCCFGSSFSGTSKSTRLQHFFSLAACHIRTMSSLFTFPTIVRKGGTEDSSTTPSSTAAIACQLVSVPVFLSSKCSTSADARYCRSMLPNCSSSWLSFLFESSPSPIPSTSSLSTASSSASTEAEEGVGILKASISPRRASAASLSSELLSPAFIFESIADSSVRRVLRMDFFCFASSSSICFFLSIFSMIDERLRPAFGSSGNFMLAPLLSSSSSSSLFKCCGGRTSSFLPSSLSHACHHPSSVSGSFSSTHLHT